MFWLSFACCRKTALLSFAVCSLFGSISRADDASEFGHSKITGRFADSDIVIRTSPRFAGAIHSLTWNGQEFIDCLDHGRELQSAANFDCGSRFNGETFNPTEAGSRFDGAGSSSTSRLLHLRATKSELQTTTRMAFWLRRGERSSGHPAKNETPLSDHLLTKRVRIGWRHWPNVIRYDVTFHVPIGEAHTYAQFEAVTGYMPTTFSRFLRFDARTGKLASLTDGPGEQRFPVVLSIPSGSHAMGVVSPDQPSVGYENAGYGRFRFGNTVKWNSVFRIRNPSGVSAGDYSYRNFVIIGDLATVERTLKELHVFIMSEKL